MTPARFSPADLTRPALRAQDVITTLADFVILTWAVDPSALAAHLPPGFTPETRVLDDGRAVAFVSAVPFRDLDFRFGGAEWAKFAMGQTNYRAYVWFRGRRAVWFFGTSLTGATVLVPQLLWKLPWHGAEIGIQATWEGEVNVHWHMETTSDWAPASVHLAGTDRPMGRLDGFADEEDTAVTLTHPLDGFFRRTDGRVGGYSVWHDRLRLHHAEVLRADVPLFTRLGLVAPGQPPHSTLLQRTTEFIVLLPPHLVEPDPDLPPSPG